MKRIIIIVSIVVVALAVVLFIYKPDFIKNTWLWFVGLIGVIVGYSQSFIQKLQDWFGAKTTEQKEKTVPDAQPLPVSDGKSDLSLLRYLDDGDLTFGMLYYKKGFYCYTLEETSTEEDSRGGTPDCCRGIPDRIRS